MDVYEETIQNFILSGQHSKNAGSSTDGQKQGGKKGGKEGRQGFCESFTHFQQSCLCRVFN